MITDAEQCIVWANPALSKLACVSLSSLLGKSPMDVFHWSDEDSTDEESGSTGMGIREESEGIETPDDIPIDTPPQSFDTPSQLAAHRYMPPLCAVYIL
jgi:PAS domain-containing protein